MIFRPQVLIDEFSEATRAGCHHPILCFSGEILFYSRVAVFERKCIIEMLKFHSCCFFFDNTLNVLNKMHHEYIFDLMKGFRGIP